jgi:hypothetical protein
LTNLERWLRAGAWSALALILGAASASSQTVVTVCGRDDATGGTNLATALAAGGAIVIRCGSAPQTIQITRTHVLPPATSIDGEGRTTLTGDGSAPMFTATGTVRLASVTVRNPGPGGGVVSRTPTTAVVVGGHVELAKVRTEGTIGPYVVKTLNAVDSVFEANGDAHGESYRAVIEAENVTLTRATFNGNHDHPIGGGPDPATGGLPAARSILIEDSRFTDNRFPLLILDASITIRRSTFVRNGARATADDGVWACCAGALTVVHSIASIEDSEFSANRTTGFGGAVAAIASRLTIKRTLFENNAGRLGGAVMFWGQTARNNFWGSGALGGLALELERARFHGNVASEVGGALVWSGQVAGDSALFVANRARLGGAVAHWGADAALQPEFAEVFPSLASLTQSGAESLAVSRAVFLDNVASQQGGALHGASAAVRLGNALVARNRVERSGATGGLYGADLTLVNATVVGNRNIGVALAAGGRSLTLFNTIVADNEAGNCSAPADKLAANQSNVQFPGGSCGSEPRSVRPSLDERYAPSLTSPARYAGHVPTCLGDELVGGRDLHGAPRANKGTCAIGSIEPDSTRDLFADTPFERAGEDPWPWVLRCLLFLILLGILIGFVRARRARACAAPQPQASSAT